MWQLPPLKQIGPEQFSDVLKSTPAATFGQIFNVTIVALALHPVTGIYPMAGLWAVNMAFCLWTLWRGHKNRGRVVTRISKKAIPRAMISSFLYALPWAVLVILFLGNIPHREEMVMGIAIMGMAAAGCVQLARIYPAALVYLATILTPVLVKSLLLGGAQYHFLAALTACYILYLFTIVLNMAIASIERSAARRESEKKIREIDEANAALEAFATRDELTGLYNRRVFNQLLDDFVSEARRGGSSVSLLFCDLDHFKNINDVAGHDEGDRLLRDVADRLRQCTGALDYVARLGGDEFAIIAREPQTPEAMMDLIHLLMDEMNRPMELDGTRVTPQISVGISVFPHDAESPEAMMKHADMALQRGKSISRNQYWFFDHQLRSKMTSDSALEADLRIALAEQQFELFYQPKVDIKTGRFHGFESLLRWRRPNGEIVVPGAFFPVAEDRGLMPYISDFVIERFIEDICAWRALGLDSGEIAVNLHPLQIKDLYRMERLARTVKQRGLAPEKIILEITEDCVVGRGTSNVPEILQIMRAHNFRISFDDFGTGYASLTHLKNLPVDEIKLDRSFICDLMANASDHSIVLAMINLAKSLGLTTVAEGIEQPEQHNILLAMGCDTGQGYFYGHPMDFESATDYLRGATANNRIEPQIESRVEPQIESRVEPQVESQVESLSVTHTQAAAPYRLSDPVDDPKLRKIRQS